MENQEKIKSSILQNLNMNIVGSYNPNKNLVFLQIDEGLFNELAELISF